MVEKAAVAAVKVLVTEVAKQDGEVSQKIDTSRPLDFSSDGNKDSRRDFDTSKLLDFSNDSGNHENSGKLDTSSPIDFSRQDEPKEKGGAQEGTETKKFPCRNEDLEGKKHPATEVPFVGKTVIDGDGKEVSVVVPEFDSIYDVQLPEGLEKATDKEQFAECNKQLKDAIAKDPALKEKFTPEQLEQIENGDTPDGYTWHHDAEKGKMQLVDSETHAKTGHTGGKVIWGGGQENR